MAFPFMGLFLEGLPGAAVLAKNEQSGPKRSELDGSQDRQSGR
jgi:hypothetical protein